MEGALWDRYVTAAPRLRTLSLKRVFALFEIVLEFGSEFYDQRGNARRLKVLVGRGSKLTHGAVPAVVIQRTKSALDFLFFIFVRHSCDPYFDPSGDTFRD